ncbi:uncharacterized protein LOC111038741 [Myzus persicae]|uniref:uncharacterized protein LOC111026703 n=1 Tax=Myzus persicae TaxID=13164 RepID=UPI000B935D4B|nr:uncharacterized protein LOC111026703 [Myzus persicae]XP_022163888.1 uncharacterized protein LOC111029243 [Myzus persicae]XP_022166240.1 uncharacterized protein LOC111030852 [Myzus persicae]XP_022175693.1 uncharacterized protein LOC111037431 [Myzus persicae]XP_022177659.1 uncharacterized protein LOC111038741 [Myzus persicae]
MSKSTTYYDIFNVNKKQNNLTHESPNVLKDHYQDLLDISKQDLRSEMTVAKNCIKSSCDKNDFKLEDIKKYVSKQVYPNVYKLLQVAITLPISSSTCERSFSAMRRLKTWLRTSMLQNRFNTISILNIEKDIVKHIDNDSIINKFARKNRTIVLQ